MDSKRQEIITEYILKDHDSITIEEKAIAYDQIIRGDYQHEEKVDTLRKHSSKRNCLVKKLRKLLPEHQTVIDYMIGSCPQLYKIFNLNGGYDILQKQNDVYENIVSKRSNVIGNRSKGGTANRVKNTTNIHHTNSVLPLDGTYFLIYGPPQSGKTSYIINISFLYITIRRCAPIVILRNSTQDSDQLKNRVDSFVKDYNRFAKIHGEKSKSLNYCYVGNSSPEKIRRFILHGYMVIAIAHKSQMTKLENALDPGMRYIVCIDEVDQVAYGEDVADFRRILQQSVLKYAGRVYGATATTFDMIFTEDKIEGSNIIQIIPSKDYYGLYTKNGINQIQKWDIGENVRPISSRDNCNDNTLIPLLERENDYDVYHHLLSENKRKITDHPNIWLIKNTHYKKKQMELMNMLVNHKDWNWTECIVLNGDGLFIQSRHLKKLRKIARRYNKKGSYMNNGMSRCLHIKTGINYGIQFFRDLMVKDKTIITHLMIISDKIADRGISFVSEDYRWTLSAQYYVPASTTSVANCIQSIRLCGISSEDRPRVLYTTKAVCEALTKGDLFQMEYLYRTQKNRDNKTSCMDILAEMPFNRYKLPKRALGTTVKKATVKRVDGPDGGFSTKRYKRKMNETKSIDTNVVDEQESKGKYLIVDIDVFGKGTKTHRMLEDVQKILIQYRKINTIVPILKVTNWLLETKYQDMTRNNIRGSTWTQIRNNPKFKTTNRLDIANTFIYGKNNGAPFVRLNM